MTNDQSQKFEVVLWALVICAFVSTALVVDRELKNISASPLSSGLDSEWSAIYLVNWRDALAVGRRSGPDDAPVQIVEFIDYQCPYCAAFEETVRAARRQYPDEVSFTFVPFPMAYHEHAIVAEIAAECAHRQDRFDLMRSVIFRSQAMLAGDPWDRFASEADIENIAQFKNCMQETQGTDRIAESVLLANQLGIQGTPTVLVNGWKWPFPPSLEHIRKAVENVTADAPPAKDIDFLGEVSAMNELAEDSR